jgi:uncharacterized membrane protein YhaH (DUF805 family)
MKWIRFFTNVDGRITRKTFWLASIAVLMIELLIAAAAAATAEEFADEATGDLAMDIVYRNISTWVIGAWYVVLATSDVLRFFGWLRSSPNQNVFSSTNLISFAFIMIAGIISLALLVELGFRRGTLGPNRYGPDALAKADAFP